MVGTRRECTDVFHVTKCTTFTFAYSEKYSVAIIGSFCVLSKCSQVDFANPVSAQKKSKLWNADFLLKKAPTGTLLRKRKCKLIIGSAENKHLFKLDPKKFDLCNS